MAKTAKGLVSFALAMQGCPYMWGTYGNLITQDLIDYKRRQYPAQYTDAYCRKLQQFIGKKRAVDCIGLVKAYMMMDSPTSSPTYLAKYDVNVGGAKSQCAKVGGISTLPEIPGLLLFIGTGHVGIYLGGGKSVEARGSREVLTANVKSVGWDAWGQLNWLDYSDAASALPQPPAIPAKPSEKGGYDVLPFLNTSGKSLPVYLETSKKSQIGELFTGSSCQCIGEVGNLAVLLYRVAATGDYKVGFTDYVKGIQK
ncbi:MAG: C40 family peptidase [Oscillospiraceae bacterium]|jgi:hypothetical protein|nr:C40 family peptidase [Oscillospiraceae bacterium]